jgi:general secretion pathway protein M
MSARLKALWASRTPRERRLLAVMLGLIALILAWLLILRPLGDMLSAAKARHGEAVEALAEARAQAAAIERLERRKPAAAAGPIDMAVAAEASQAGFQLSQLQPRDGDRVALAIGSARPQALFGWVAGLEARGLIVDTLSASANPDRTLSAQIVLRRRGS